MGDLDAIVGLGERALARSPHPGLSVDPEKLRALASHCLTGQYRLTGPRTYAQVAFHEVAPETLVAACLAIADEMACYRGGEVTVVQFYSEAPGAGLGLVRNVMRWAQSDRWVQAIAFEPLSVHDHRTVELLRLLGLQHETLTLSWHRGGSESVKTHRQSA